MRRNRKPKGMPGKFKLLPVSDQASQKAFLCTARILYANDKNWVCPLDSAIQAVFDPQKNHFFKHGTARRWVLFRGKENLGRIAAFIDKRKAFSFAQPTGGIGFFECINDQKAANMLFDTAKQWLAQNGMQAMDGPINFGRNQQNWGLLVQNFSPPSFGMNYNPQYYQTLFENYGFRLFFKQYSYTLDLQKPFSERFSHIAAWVLKKPEYVFKNFSWHESEKLFTDIVQIFNASWNAQKKDFTPMEKQDFQHFFEQRRFILQKNLIWVAYYRRIPVAFVSAFPDFNQILTHFHGKIGFRQKFFLALGGWKKQINRVRVAALGRVPRFEKAGIEMALFWKLQQELKKNKQYKEIELSWVGDFETYTHRLYNSLGAEKSKQHNTYRYLFDRQKTFERYPLKTDPASEKTPQ